MQDRYTDIQLNWSNVHYAGKLCNDGPCKCIVKQAAGITGKSLCRNVVPNFTTAFGNVVDVILVKPLLWAAFHLQCLERLAPEIKHRILSAFIQLERREVDVSNPVPIVEIIAIEVNGVVLLVDMIVNEEDGEDRICAQDITTHSRQWRAHVFARLGNTAKITMKIQTFQRSEFAAMNNQIRGALKKGLGCCSMRQQR